MYPEQILVLKICVFALVLIISLTVIYCVFDFRKAKKARQREAFIRYLAESPTLNDFRIRMDFYFRNIFQSNQPFSLSNTSKLVKKTQWLFELPPDLLGSFASSFILWWIEKSVDDTGSASIVQQFALIVQKLRPIHPFAVNRKENLEWRKKMLDAIKKNASIAKLVEETLKKTEPWLSQDLAKEVGECSRAWGFKANS